MAKHSALPLKLPPASRILVVNDVRDVANLICEMLKAMGYAVNCAYDGLAGLRLARIIVPDLILLNQMMPGLCGLEVLAKLRTEPKTRHIKVILHSARPMEDRALNAGAESFLQVPFQKADLRRRVGQVLERSS